MEGTLTERPGLRIETWDQSRLPFEEIRLVLRTPEDCADAIRTMKVRGAPLIGIVGAYGLAMAAHEDASDGFLGRQFEHLLATRPTAVNLRWALERTMRAMAGLPERERAEAGWRCAGELARDDAQANRCIGEHGVRLLEPLIDRAAGEGRALQILTHCHAGAMATMAYGTALAPLHRLRAMGVDFHVWVDETRPRNQGALLTAWELARAGISHTVVADNAGGLLMMQRRVDAVLVGCDRVAANGDVANKIGTYLKALAASAHEVPFYVACPVSTIDPRTPDGASIPIEERSADEMRCMRGLDADGRPTRVQVMLASTEVINPAFDVTPAALVTALITEHGVCAARSEAIAELLRIPPR